MVALRSVRVVGGSLEVWTEDLEVHRGTVSLQLLAEIALSAQPIIVVEKA